MHYTRMTSSIMFKRRAIKDLNGFDESFKRHQEYEIMRRFVDNHTIEYIRDILLDSERNQGENRMYGKRLDELKAFYFKTFESKIAELDAASPGLKDDIYSKHYASTFWNHINHNNYKLGLNVLATNLRDRPIKFTRDAFKLLIKHIKKLIKET